MTRIRTALAATVASLALTLPAAAQTAPDASATPQASPSGAQVADGLAEPAAEDAPEAANGVAPIARSLTIADRERAPNKPGLDDAAAAGDATPGVRPGIEDGAKENDTAEMAPRPDGEGAPAPSRDVAGGGAPGNGAPAAVSDGVGEDGMAAAADGAEQREETVDEIIRRADAPTIGATDVDRGAVTTPSGMQFDMEAFAREMFEQGYRQGYVSGLTQARTDAVRRMQERERAQQARAEMQREAERQRRTDAMQRGANGETVIILPPGVSPQEFLRSLAAQ
jgi:hypothetical protein